MGDVDGAVILVHDDGAAGAHHGATGNEGVIVDRGVEVLFGQAAAGRTAGLDGFELLATGDAAADFIDELAEGRSHRDLNEADVVDLAAEGEDLRAFGAFGADGIEGGSAFADDERNLREGFDVVDAGRLAPKTFDGREGRTGTRHAALTLDGVKQGGLFAADERAGAKTEMGAEGEVGAKDVVAEQASGLHVLDRVLKPFDGDRVFGTDVEVTFGRAEGIASEHHTLDDFKGVAFEDGAVHERAGVAFVAVADDVFLIGLDVSGELPLTAGGESTAATSADAGGEDLVDDFLRGHRGEGLLQGLEAVVAEGFLELVGVDEGAAVEGDADLFLVEGDVILTGDLLVGDRVDIEEVFANLTADEVLFHDFGHVFDLDAPIEGVFGEDFDEGPLGAEAEATDVVDGDPVLEAFFLDEANEFFLNGYGIVGDTAGTAADDDGPLATLAFDLGLEDRGAFVDALLK